MCDQTEVQYLDGDVVWVKIGPVWWPGVVKDLDNEEGKEILAGLKKKPIACVKFFNEENYEFVKNLDQIYHYNCRKKDEFIKKGLDKCRSGAEHMKKFPADVTTAESLVHGDVNIINDPKFQPEEKQNYSDIFGTGKKKKKKEKEISPRFRPRSSPATPQYRPITHQRFINKALHGESDHKVRTLIQPSTSPDEPAKKIYKCHVCKLEASRVNVIVDHVRLAHSSTQAVNWTGSDGQLVRRKPTYKSRKLKIKKLFDSFDEDSNDVSLNEPKRKSPVKKASKDKVKAETKTKTKTASSPAKSTSSSPGKRKAEEDVSKVLDPKKPRFTDVLLADWSEDEDDGGNQKSEDEKPKSEADPEETNEGEKEDAEPEENEPEGKTEDGSHSSDDSSKAANEEPKNEKMSCFDFDEEEEGFIGMSNANTYGRKIPRVIPVKDKSDLGVDLEIEELFKRKSESDAEDVKMDETLDDKQATDSQNETADEDGAGSKSDPDFKEEKKVKGKRGRKPLKDKVKEPPPPVSQDSLALRRTRRPGAKKSYLNEVIEKIEVDEDGNEKVRPENPDSDSAGSPVPKAEVRKVVQESTGSSSRRKQDLKSLGVERDELIYSDVVKSDQKAKPAEKKSRKKSSDKKETEGNDDLTKQIDQLLGETNVPDLPPAPESKTDKQTEESSNTLSLSFDYVPTEQGAKKILGKPKSEGKSISKMFSDCLDNSQQEAKTEGEVNTVQAESGNLSESPSTSSQSLIKKVTSPPTSPRKKGTVILSPLSKTVGASGGKVAVLPVLKTAGTTSKGGCVILSSGEKVDLKKIVAEAKQDPGSPVKESETKTKTIKTIKLKPDSLPTSLLASGKLKGQTIIHQKGGKYVIVTQPPSGQQKIIPGKPTTPNKVVILTNQHGEQKIITTGGLKQSRLSQKLLASPDSADKGDSSTSPPGVAGVKQTQPFIKMVPDGKGGVMKQLTVSPKKVILGGTKVLVTPSSASSSATSSRETVQKIALPSGGGDFRLIENYKGSGKTVLIQSTSGPGNVILKSSSTVPRQTVSRVIQAPKNILSLQKKPKIVMKASGGQSEQYVVHSGVGTAVETPTYVMKKKGADGKIATQRVIRRPVVQAKTSSTASGSKTIFLSAGQVATQKGESIIIKSGQDPLTNLVRLKSSQKEAEATTLKPVTKIVQKAPEVFATAQNSYVLATETTGQTSNLAQTVQVQEQTQQPVLQTQVVAMPTIGPDGNQTYMLVSVDEQTGQWQTVDNSIIAYDITGQPDQVFVNPTATNNVILIDNQQSGELAPVFSTASQDILAEALANTNVLDGSISTEMEPVMPSILLPPAIPSSVVQETSITLQKPIMTPLEMPSSVAPDTSGLEPPPLPPTPTEEDVLMEEPEGSLSIAENIPEEELIQEKTADESQIVEEAQICTDVITTETYSESEGTHLETVEQSYEETEYQEENRNGDYANGNEEAQSNVVYYQADEYQEEKVQEDFENRPPGEDFIIENSQEEQGANSFQSMPLLNDEPDTSDDAQGSEPIADQDFELQKSRMGNGDFSPLLREQEPPSSTNNEIVTESNYENNEISYQTYQEKLADNNSAAEDQTFQEDEGKEKESSDNKDNQSMPVISDEGNVNSFEVDPSYANVISQKRFQEETEVTSTTDEFTNKDNVV